MYGKKKAPKTYQGLARERHLKHIKVGQEKGTWSISRYGKRNVLKHVNVCKRKVFEKHKCMASERHLKHVKQINVLQEKSTWNM